MAERNYLVIGGKKTEIYRGAINATTIGNNTIVAAVAGCRIRVLACFFTGAATGTGVFQDGAGGTALTGTMVMNVNSPIRLQFNPAGWFETSVATLLNLVLTGAGNEAQGHIVYTVVPNDAF